MRGTITIILIGFFSGTLMGFFPYDRSGELGLAFIYIFWLIISILFAAVYYSDYKRIRFRYFLITYIIVFGFIINLSFPCGEEPYPAKVIYQSINTIISYNKVTYNDVFQNNDHNVIKRIVAFHRYKDNLPEKIYNCTINLNSDSLGEFNKSFFYT